MNGINQILARNIVYPRFVVPATSANLGDNDETIRIGMERFLDDLIRYMTSVVSAVEAGNGVAVAVEALGYAFGNRVKLVRLTPEPKPISFGIAARKGRLSPAADKFWQCAREAASKK